MELFRTVDCRQPLCHIMYFIASALISRDKDGVTYLLVIKPIAPTCPPPPPKGSQTGRGSRGEGGDGGQDIEGEGGGEGLDPGKEMSRWIKVAGQE
jgi:hypothetical protein